MKVPIIILAFLGLICGKPLPIGKLQDELNEFLVLVPTDKILEIALDYLAYDPEVKEFVVYIQSEEFPKIHRVVEYLKEYKDCFKFFNDQGVDVYAIVNEIHDILEEHPFQPTNTTRTGVGFYGLIKDVVAVLPLDDWTALLDKKLEAGDLFKTLVTATPVFMKMVDNVRTWPEYHELLEILREMVVKVEPSVELLWEIFLRETRSLQEDLHDFMALIPSNKIFDIVLDYLLNYKELQEFFVYIRSEEFPKIHKIVEYLKENNCFKFYNDEGVDFYAIINEIRDILHLPPFQPTNTTRNGVGIYGLVDDVIAVLPLDDMKALFDKKTETREYFKTLVKVLKSPVLVKMVHTVRYSFLPKMVDTVRSLPEYHEVLEILREKVVDVDRIVELFRKLYWRGTHKLQYELKERMALFPTKKVLEIVLDYLAYDEEVRQFLVYIQSEKFPKIHKIVEHLKEYKDCLKFINDEGVDVYEIINEIHDALGFPPFEPTNTTRTGVSIYGLIDDVISVLPLDYLTALFGKKMDTREIIKNLVTAFHSPVFMNMVDDLKALLGKKIETKQFVKNLVSAIHSPVFVKMVDTVRAWPEYDELLDILREMVVDVERIIKILWELSLRGSHIIQDDLKEFMELIPTDKVIQITLDYLANDPELHEMFVYIQSEEFPKIHKIVEYLKKYKYCLKFIDEYGVDVYAFILEIHDILGLPPFEPTNTTRTGVGIYGLIDDVFAALPVEDLKTFFYMKMETREYFKVVVTAIRKTVITTIRSPLFLKMVEIVKALPEYKKLLETLLKAGVDVVGIIKHVRVLLGLPPV